MRSWIFSLIVLAALPSVSFAQPFNVRAWYAAGQVFIVWQQGPPATPLDTVEIYASAGAQASTTNMTLVGQLFFPEYTGARLAPMLAGARIRVPTPGGGTYLLAIDEGVFVYTPHAAGNLFFAVVDTLSTNVGALNSAATAFGYDPVNNPVRAHAQFNTFTPGGNPSTAYIVWADGRADYDDSRPDFPVLANAAKNGVPHVFAITLPLIAPPPGPLPCVFVMHGGGDAYQLFRPGVPDRSNMSLPLDDGIVVSPDDAFYLNVFDTMNFVNNLVLSNTDWFGYWWELDPFSPFARTNPPINSVIVNLTARRVHWILDWLLGPNSPYTVDAARVAMVGHSGGARGTSHLTRLRPERFCAAVCYNFPGDQTIVPGPNQVDPLLGTWSDYLDTNLSLPGIGVLTYTAVAMPTTRLSALHRDLPLTRFYFGKRDEGGAPNWSPAQRAVLDSLNASQMGHMVFWDEREHPVPEWSQENQDMAGDPCTPWPDIGQWVHPVKTLRPAAQTLVDNYRNNQSHPGFFNTDEDLIAPDRQPDPGPGDYCAAGWSIWGSWGGCLDWDTTTLTDTTSQWACTMFLVGLSAVSVDNSLVAQLQADLSIRRPQSFAPPAGTSLFWTLSDSATNLVMQSGTTSVAADGLVTVAGLLIPKDPARVRLTFNFCPGRKGDFTNDNAVTSADISAFVTILLNGPTDATELCKADMNSDSAADGRDIITFASCLIGGQCP